MIDDSEVQSHWSTDLARAWSLYVPPARPSAGETRLYQQLIEEHRLYNSSHWLLLGSTPEIRSLSGRYARTLLAVDINPGVFAELAALVDPIGEERLVCGDWSAIELPSPVSAGFADGSFTMVHPRGHDTLIRNIARMFVPGGIFVVRVHLRVNPPFSSAEELFEALRKHGSAESIVTRARSCLDMLWLNPETGHISVPDMNARIRMLHERGVLSDEEYAPFSRLASYNKLDLYYSTRDSFEALISPYFEIVSHSTSGDYTGHELHPIYVLKRRDTVDGFADGNGLDR